MATVGVKRLKQSHYAETDANKILTAFPLENWRRPPGRSRTTWMKTLLQDLKSNNLSLNETILRGSESSTLETFMFGAEHS